MPVKTQYDPNKREASGTALVDYVIRTVLDFDDFDAGDDYRIPVNAGETVLDVRCRVATAFDVATAIVVGDSADADGYLKTAQLDPASLGAFERSFRGGDEDGVSGVTTKNGYAAGKHYTAADFILFALNGNPTVGQLVVDVQYCGYGHGFERGQINNTGLS